MMKPTILLQAADPESPDPRALGQEAQSSPCSIPPRGAVRRRPTDRNRPRAIIEHRSRRVERGDRGRPRVIERDRR